MSQIMTFEEIKLNYDKQWVLIAPIETDENLQVVKGKVIAHADCKKDIYRALESTEDASLAIEYIGQVPEDIAFIL